MGKLKSKVLTIKIQLKVNFPQAVITNIRTLPLVFTVFTEICTASSFMEIKMLLKSKKFSRKWQRKHCFRKFCIIWELNEAWPMKKDSGNLLRLLKLLKLKRIFITILRLSALFTIEGRGGKEGGGWAMQKGLVFPDKF